MLSQEMQKGREHAAPPCIWTQAGIGGYKRCRIDYTCATCRYDRMLQRIASDNRRQRVKGITVTGRRGQIVSWKEKLRSLPQSQRPCLHHMKGRIEFRACTNDYRCPNCEFDQYFEDQFTVYTNIKPVDFLDVDGFKIPQGYYMHHGHTWVKIEAANTVRIGLDDFARRVLGPFDGIDAPLMGKPIVQGQRGITLKNGSNTARLLSPVTGVVTASNPAATTAGITSKDDAYSGGWILRVHSENLRHDLTQLMIGEEASTFLAEEVNHLYDLIEETAGPLAADGGQLGSDIYGQMPELGWNRLVGAILRT